MSDDDNKLINDYEVGHGKPPKHSQFPKGQSGNPRGRPKGSKNFRTLLAQELDQKLEIQEGGKLVKITKQEALVKRLVNNALQGDPRATSTVVPLIIDFNDANETNNLNKPLSDHEIEILNHYLKKQTSHET